MWGEDTESKIQFYFEDIDPIVPDLAALLRKWIPLVIRNKQKELEQVNIIFCSDPYLHQINQEYLNHDTYTDIITFPYSEPPLIEGDIFISVDRVKENAQTFKVEFPEELSRIIIHGILHLCGFKDKSKNEKQIMTSEENTALELLKTLSAS